MPESSGLKKALEKGSLHEIIKAVHESESARESLQEVRLYVLNNHTVDNLRWFLQGMAYAEGFGVAYAQGPYDAIMQDILEPDSTIHRSHPDVIVLSLLIDTLVPDFVRNQFAVASVIERLHQMIAAIRSRSSAIIIGNTFLLPPSSAEGVAGSKNPDSLENKVRAINTWCGELAAKTPNFFLIDFNLIEQRLGMGQSRDYRLWFTARALLTTKFLQAYAREILKIVCALNGKSKKCLVVDCDNTLWGGTIGEDGIDGIRLDAHQYPGNIFYRVQENILALLDRGVVLCLCSKNNPEDVWEVLDTHPHCLIKRSHVSAWRIDWDSKASNVESLAEELGLGMDSLVFVDDEAAECEFVGRSHPELHVLQVPANLFSYPQLFFENGGFDALSVSREDRQRGAMYQAEAIRKKESERHESVEEFLASLDMAALIRPVQSNDIQRVAQLTQKTNQFNLTTRRYSEGEIRSLAEDPNCGIFTLSVTDKFGDMGLTGVLIAKRQGRTAHIDSCLLSCRVLGRRLEHTFLDVCMTQLETAWRPDVWTSEYLPTKKNRQAAGFWPQLGFEETIGDQNARSASATARSLIRCFSLRADRRRSFAAPFIHIVKESA